MWLLFGCIFLLMPLILFGEKRSVALSLTAATLFFINAYLNWKKTKNNQDI